MTRTPPVNALTEEFSSESFVSDMKRLSGAGPTFLEMDLTHHREEQALNNVIAQNFVKGARRGGVKADVPYAGSQAFILQAGGKRWETHIGFHQHPKAKFLKVAVFVPMGSRDDADWQQIKAVERRLDKLKPKLARCGNVTADMSSTNVTYVVHVGAEKLDKAKMELPQMAPAIGRAVAAGLLEKVESLVSDPQNDARLQGMNEATAADVTLKQLGGMNRLRAMIGLKHAMHSNGGKTLILKFPNKAAGKPNHVEITIDPDDTYSMKFLRTRGLKVKEVKKVKGVYADQLREIFEKTTGLYLSLGTMKHKPRQESLDEAKATLDRKTRQKANAALVTAGFGGRKRWQKPGLALSDAFKVLQHYGIEPDEIADSHALGRSKGTLSIDIAYSNPQDSFSPQSISNSVLHISWEELKKYSVEVIAYLS